MAVIKRSGIKRVASRVTTKVKSAGGSALGSFLDFNAALQDVIKGVIGDMKSSVLSLLILAIGMTIASHHSGVESSIIYKVCNDERKDTAICKMILTNVDRFLGALAFIPAVIAAPGSMNIVVAIIVYASIYLLPALASWEYTISALVVHMYFRVKRPATRVILIAIVVTCWSLGMMTKWGIAPPVDGGDTTKPPPLHRDKRHHSHGHEPDHVLPIVTHV